MSLCLECLRRLLTSPFASSFVIDELDQSPSGASRAVAYIYFNYKDEDHQTPTNVIRSLLNQLVAQSSSSAVLGPSETLYDGLAPKHKTPTLEQLQTAVVATLKSHHQVFFVFDALDECVVKHRKDLLPFFHRLADAGARIFITSRPHPRDVQESFTKVSSAKTVELAAHVEDIKIYVEEKINEHPSARVLICADLREKIVNALTRCCNGM